MIKKLVLGMLMCGTAAACVGSSGDEWQGRDSWQQTQKSEAVAIAAPLDFASNPGLDVGAAKTMSGGKAIYTEACEEEPHTIAQGTLNADGFQGYAASNARNVAVNPADGLLYSVHINADQDFEVRRSADGVTWNTVFTRFSAGITYDPALAILADGTFGIAARTNSGFYAYTFSSTGTQLHSYLLRGGVYVSLSPPSIAASADQFYVAFAGGNASGGNRKVGVRRLKPGGGVSGSAVELSLHSSLSGSGCTWSGYENYHPSIAVGQRGPSGVPVDQQDELFVAASVRMNCPGASVIAAPLWHGTTGLGMNLLTTASQMHIIPSIVGANTWNSAGLSLAANKSGRAYVGHSFSSSVLGNQTLIHAYQYNGAGGFDSDLVSLGGVPGSISVAAHPTQPNAFKAAWSNPLEFGEGTWDFSTPSPTLVGTARTLSDPGSHRTPNAVYWSTCSQGYVCDLTTAYGTRSGLQLTLRDELRCCEEACLPDPDPTE